MPLLKDVVIIFGMAVVVLWICNRLRIPSIVGFLFTGILTGPYGLKLVEEIANVNILAEVGILFLLFTIGLELSLSRLLEIKRYFFLGGLIQVGLTVIAGFAIASLAGRPLGEAIFLGFLLSMSSTAIVLKTMEIKNESNSPQGLVALGILIFQDIVAVPMMLLTPILGSSSGGLDQELIIRLLLGFVVIALIFPIAIKVVPPILHQIARARSRELFLLSILTICFSVAWLASAIGLSLALGAFLAGVIISKSDYRYEVIGNIIPLQDIFISLFFVSIGMLLDYQFILDHPFAVGSITLGIIALKSVIVGFAAMCLGMPLRVMILVGIALSQIGEFSFVLAKAGINVGLANGYLYQLFLAVALITMVLTPSLMNLSHYIVHWAQKLPIPEKWKTGKEIGEETTKHRNHIVIVGFGLSGRNLARIARASRIDYVILELNPDTVNREKQLGQPIHFGDGTHEAVLRHLNVQDAKTIAIMINDPRAAHLIVSMARKINPNAFVIVRTRYVQDVRHMQELGANDVVPDEFGASLEVCVRVLRWLQVPEEKISRLTDVIRSEGVV